jgi:hypothetical protein
MNTIMAFTSLIARFSHCWPVFRLTTPTDEETMAPHLIVHSLSDGGQSLTPHTEQGSLFFSTGAWNESHASAPLIRVEPDPFTAPANKTDNEGDRMSTLRALEFHILIRKSYRLEAPSSLAPSDTRLRRPSILAPASRHGCQTHHALAHHKATRQNSKLTSTHLVVAPNQQGNKKTDGLQPTLNSQTS